MATQTTKGSAHNVAGVGEFTPGLPEQLHFEPIDQALFAGDIALRSAVEVTTVGGNIYYFDEFKRGNRGLESNLTVFAVDDGGNSSPIDRVRAIIPASTYFASYTRASFYLPKRKPNVISIPISAVRTASLDEEN